jgi:large subunit ribosomal protein L34e
MKVPKSKSKRKVFVKTPGGKTIVHYKPKKPKVAHCSNCGDSLKGVIRGTSAQIKNATKTQKRPTRPYGGVLCSKCTRETIKNKARSQ